MTAFSERYEAALILAGRSHRAQVRKGGDIPYIVHLAHVSVILVRHGFAEDVAIAGLLHDIVEDQDVAVDDIEAAFGASVAEMVAALTEWKREGDKERSWSIRKRQALAQVRRASREAVAVKAADTLHSTRSLASDLRREGPSIWRHFSRGPDESLWYYQSVAALVRERWNAHPLADELDQAVQDLEQVITETEGR